MAAAALPSLWYQFLDHINHSISQGSELEAPWPENRILNAPSRFYDVLGRRQHLKRAGSCGCRSVKLGDGPPPLQPLHSGWTGAPASAVLQHTKGHGCRQTCPTLPCPGSYSRRRGPTPPSYPLSPTRVQRRMHTHTSTFFFYEAGSG